MAWKAKNIFALSEFILTFGEARRSLHLRYGDSLAVVGASAQWRLASKPFPKRFATRLHRDPDTRGYCFRARRKQVLRRGEMRCLLQFSIRLHARPFQFLRGVTGIQI